MLSAEKRGTSDRPYCAGSAKASGTVSLSFQFPSVDGNAMNGAAGLKLPVNNLTVPIFFTVPLTDGPFTSGRGACPAVDASNATAVLAEKTRHGGAYSNTGTHHFISST